MSALKKITRYFTNIYESVTTILTGMWITFKTALFEGKVTIQYPSFDVSKGQRADESLFSERFRPPPFEALMGANQEYRGPLNRKVSDRYRGFLGYREEDCTSCSLCVNVCPIEVIFVEGVKVEGRKGRAPITFSIDYGMCIYCGLCVEACREDALFFTREFEAAAYRPFELVKDHVPPETRQEALRMAAEYELKKEAQKAAKASGGEKVKSVGRGG